MNTINSTSNSYNFYTQNNTQVSNPQDHSKAHHHHKKMQPQDSSQFSQEGLHALQGTDPKSPLADLVANGTITQDQENSIKSAFQSARQTNGAGTYDSKPTNPISSLVANGTLTEDQASAIKDAFKSAQKTQQIPLGVHGHHHRHQSQNVTESSETTSQSSSNSL